MRVLAIIFLALIALIQYPLWFGKGGWLQVRELNQKLNEQRQHNAGLKARNETLTAEVQDLKQGVEAIEERARTELGMIKKEEVFFQIVESVPAPKRGGATAQ